MINIIIFFIIVLNIQLYAQSSYKINLLIDCHNPSSKLDCHPDNFINNKVFGITNQQALSFDGSLNNDSICSKNHYNNDFSNRWCHAYLTKSFQQSIYHKNNLIKHLTASSFFIQKEFLLDKKPSMSDIVLSEYPIHSFSNNDNVNVSIFGDGLWIFSFYKKF